MKKIVLPIFIASAMSIFNGCSDSNSNTPDEELNTNTYIINETENKDIPITAEFKSISTEQAEVKLTRDVEADSVNVYVIKGSVEVTEIVEE